MTGDQLIRLRGRLGLRQVDLAKELGMTKSHLNRLEKGKMTIGPRVENHIRDFAFRYGIVDDLLTMSGDMQSVVREHLIDGRPNDHLTNVLVKGGLELWELLDWGRKWTPGPVITATASAKDAELGQLRDQVDRLGTENRRLRRELSKRR